jgi:hypothetical protein
LLGHAPTQDREETTRAVVVTRLAGGLGNQLFQYAAGRSLAARLGVELILDSSWIHGRGGAPPNMVRQYHLGRFKHGNRLEDAGRVGRLPPMTRLQFHSRRVLPRRGKPDLRALVQANQPEVDDRVFGAPDNTYLIGNWESERYFEEHAELIRRELEFLPPSPDVQRLVDQIGDGTTASVHVRRGDKLSNPTAARIHPTLSLDWYADAVRELLEHVASLERLIVFSDDPVWCREHLALPLPTTFATGNSDSDDLQLMSRCSNHVIANSTFSWWGAWLDPDPAKTVVAPASWRRDRPTVDVVPPGWIQLPNR